MRDIPPLSVLCLRAIASHACSTEETFAPVDKNGKKIKVKTDEDDTVKRGSILERASSIGSKSDMAVAAAAVAAVDVPTFPGSASKLLRSFHQRPQAYGDDKGATTTPMATDEDKDDNNAIRTIPLQRTPAIGAGSGRRKQANDVDLNHPWIAVYHPSAANEEVVEDETAMDTGAQENDEDTQTLPAVPTDPSTQILVAQYGSPAQDLLQSYIDSLVEMGRMDDTRLRLHFFQELKANIELQNGGDVSSDTATKTTTTTEIVAENEPPIEETPSKGKKRGRKSPVPSSKKKKGVLTHPSAMGSLSLHNAIFLEDTLNAIIKSNVLANIAVLDLTGVSTLDDGMLQQILQASNSQLQRLSVKNCRRLTNKSMQNLVQNCFNLVGLDLGGAYNITPQCVLDSLSPLQSATTGSLSKLLELHASGLGWTNDNLETLFSLRPWRGLSVGFSPLLHFGGWKDAIWEDSSEAMCSRLQSLAVPFCEGLIDNAWLGMMGRHVPHLRALDVRGCIGLNSMTGWYDGRATIVPNVPLQQSLIVLARYSNITKSSVEDTKRVHPAAALQLEVILDSGGVGLGILRLEEVNE